MADSGMACSKCNSNREVMGAMKANLATKELEVQAAKTLATAAVAEAKRRWTVKQSAQSDAMEVTQLTVLPAYTRKAIHSNGHLARQSVLSCDQMCREQSSAMWLSNHVQALSVENGKLKEQLVAALRGQKDGSVSRAESDEFFELYDTDCSGSVDANELVEMVASFKQTDSSKLNRAKIKEVWDADGDGTVTKAEFHERLMKAAETNAALFEQFRVAAAKKKSGTVSNPDARHLLQAPDSNDCVELQMQLSELRQEVSTLLSQKAGAQDEVEVLENEVSAQRTAFQSESAMFKKEISTLNQEKKVLKSCSDALQEQVAMQWDEERKSNEVEMQALAEQISGLQTKIAQLQNQNKELAENQVNARSGNHALQEEVAAHWQAEREMSEQKIEELTLQVSSLLDDKAAADAARELVEEKVALKWQAERESSEVQIRELEQELARNKSELLATETGQRLLEEQVAVQWQAERDKSQASSGESEVRILELLETVAGLEKEKASMLQQSNMQSEWADEKLELEAKLSELCAEIGGLLNDKADSENRIRLLKQELKSEQGSTSASEAASLSAGSKALEEQKALQESISVQWQAERRTWEQKVEKLNAKLKSQADVKAIKSRKTLLSSPLSEREECAALAAELQKEKTELRKVSSELRSVRQQQTHHSCTENQLPELRHLKAELKSARTHIVKMAAGLRGSSDRIKVVTDRNVSSTMQARDQQLQTLSDELAEALEEKATMEREHSFEIERRDALFRETQQRHKSQIHQMDRPVLEMGAIGEMLKEAMHIRDREQVFESSSSSDDIRMTTLRTQMAQATDLNRELEEENESLREQLDNQSNRRDRIHSIEKVLRELQARLATQVDEGERLQNELDEVTTERDKLSQSVIVLRGQGKDNTDRERRVQKYFDASAELVWGHLGLGLEEWVRGMRAECMAQQDEIAALVDETVREQDEIAQRNKQVVDDMSSRLELAEQETTALRQLQQQEQYDAGNGALELETQKRVVTQQLSDTQSELNAQSQITQVAHENHERILQAIGGELMHMQTTVRGWVEPLLSAGLPDSYDTLHKLDSAAEALPGAHNSSPGYQEPPKEPRALVLLVQGISRALCSVIGDLCSQLKMSEARVENEAMALMEMAEESEQTREQLLQSQKNLKVQEQEARAHDKELAVLNRKVEGFNEERDDHTDRVQRLEAAVSARMDDVETLRAQLSGQLGEDSQLMGEFTRQISVLQKDLRAKETVVVELQRKVRIAQTDQRDYKFYRKTADETQERLETVELVILQQEEEKEIVQSECDAKELENSKLKHQETKLQQQVKHLAATIEQLQSRLKSVSHSECKLLTQVQHSQADSTQIHRPMAWQVSRRSELELFVEELGTKRALQTLRAGDVQVRKPDGALVTPAEELRVIREIQSLDERAISTHDSFTTVPTVVAATVPIDTYSSTLSAESNGNLTDIYSSTLSAEWAKVDLSSEDNAHVTPLTQLASFADDIRGVRPSWQGSAGPGLSGGLRDIPWRP